MLLLIFQASIVALIALFFIMVVSVPVIFVSLNSWDNNKLFIFVKPFQGFGLTKLVVENNNHLEY